MAYTTINKSSDYFNTKLYTGTGSSATVTGVGFQPDFFWIKQRNSSNGHVLWDATRGGNYYLASSSTSGQANDIGTFTAASDGYSLATDSAFNGNGSTYVGWNWKAGTTSGQATNGDTTITPTSISFNQTSGFSIIKYLGNATAGAGVPHGLGVAPKMVMVKNIDSGSYGWYCYHASLGATKSLYLHNTDAVVTSNDRWNGWLPDATNVYLGTNHGVNGGSNNIIMYCFAEKTGYSKFGSYTGNGNADGTFVYTGFKPAWIMYKNSGYTGAWIMYDNKRDPHNLIDTRLEAQGNFAESTSSSKSLDFLSNGFKMRGVDNAQSNWDGNTYIYMAFAESPLVGSNNVPCTAR